MDGHRTGNTHRNKAITGGLTLNGSKNNTIIIDPQGVLINRGDRMSTKGVSERPSKVDLSIKFLYLVVCIGIVRTVMTVMRHVDVRSPNLLIFTKLLEGKRN